MNQQEQAELARLKQQQLRLAEELRRLSDNLASFEQRVSHTGAQAQARTALPLEPFDEPSAPGASPTLPSRPETGQTSRPDEIPSSALNADVSAPQPVTIPPAVPPIIRTAATAQTQAQATTQPAMGHRAAPPSRPPPTATSHGPPFPAPPPPPKATSFEMRLGTFWFVRIGVVLVLTSLVFFGTLAYHNYISRLGPEGKISLLYLAGAVLLGAGWFWQRKAANETLKNYAQVLFAGGLAALYFTTYAAYYIEPLRVVQNRALDGILLLLCAGFMVWVAERKSSELLAVFAVGLAYYTSIITRVGYFTLYSNLVLTAAAVFFLLRNRWVVISFGSLVASYGAYGFWRFFDGNAWHWAATEGLWAGTYFLFSYWLMLTAAVFLCRDQKFAGQNRAGFLTLNNGSLFAMFLLTMLQVRQGGFWEFALIYGGVLLALSELARAWLRTEPLTRDAYIAQGLLLVTVGLISKFAGLQLALILAMESVVLLVSGQQRKNLVLLAGAYIAAALSVGWAMDGMRQMEPAGVWLAVGIGALMMANTLLSHRRLARAAGPAEATPLPAQRAGAPTRPQPAFFTLMALVIWFAATWNNAPRNQFALVLALEALPFIFSYYLLAIPEITLFGFGYLALAQVIWVGDVFGESQHLPWWNPVLLLLLSLGVSQWWQLQKLLTFRPPAGLERHPIQTGPVWFKNLVLLGATQFAVSSAGGWDLGSVPQSGLIELYLPLLLGGLIMADTLLARRTASAFPLRPQPAYSTALALVVWLTITWHQTAHESFPLVLAGEGLLLTFTYYLLRIPEITLLAQGYILLAQLAWVLRVAVGGVRPPWWNPSLLVALTLGLNHWWQRQRVLELGPESRRFWQAAYAAALMGLLYFWLVAEVSAPVWLVLTSLLAVGLTIYGVTTRTWLVAAFGQVFVVVSGLQFGWQLAQAKPAWPFALAPIAALAALCWGTVRWFNSRPGSDPRVQKPLLEIARTYRWLALLMTLTWVAEYIPARERIWVLALLGLVVFLWAGRRRNPEALLFAAVFDAAAVILFWLPTFDVPKVYWPNLLALLALLTQREFARRLTNRFQAGPPCLAVVVLAGGLSLWRLLSLWVLESASGFYLTASWSLLALALFTAGIVLRGRPYRWLGLGILACALGRVAIFDVWKLQALYRVLSLLALGVVLLVLGFIYSKYQEKIKEWL